LLLGFVELAPYFGAALGRLLRVWALLAAVIGLAVVLDVRPWQAAVTGALGFALERLIGGLGGEVPARVECWFWRAATGQATRHVASELPALLKERLGGGGREP
jgi:hypothetical protein